MNNSSAGHDELPLFVAKSCIEEFIEPLTYMINESLRTGICPSELKIARVVPIFKTGDPSLLTNYIDLYLFYHFLVKYLKELSMIICLISFVQIIYCMIISLDSDQDIPPNKQ